MNGHAELYAGPTCSADAFEDPSRENWVNCAMRREQFYRLVGLSLYVVVALMLIWIGAIDNTVVTGAAWYNVTLRVFLIITGVAVVGWAGLGIIYNRAVADTLYSQAQHEISLHMADGRSRADAFDAVRSERLKREHIAAIKGRSSWMPWR